MDELLRDELRQAFQQFVTFTYGLLQGIVVLLVATILARMLRGRVRRRLAATLAPENAKRMAENLVALAVFGFAVTLVLSLWGVTWSTLLTAIGVSTLFVAFGLQSALQSFVAGIFILFERPYNVGDHIRFSGPDVEGTVEEIAFRTTVIRNDDGTRVVAPNSFIFTQAVANHSPDRAMLTIITVHGAGGFGHTTGDIREKVEEALADVPGFSQAPEVMVNSRFGSMQAPQSVSRIPRLGASAARLKQAVVAQTTQVRVSWRGRSDSAVREEVLRRLRQLFPEARIGVRRW